MKKQFLKYLLILFVMIGAAVTSQAQVRVYVKTRPTVVVTERTAIPHPHYVWVGDEWTIRNGAYVNVAGHWVAPRPGFVWVPGHWTTEKRGDYWIAGHWRKL